MKAPRPLLTIACVLALGAVAAWANSVSTPNIPVVGPVLNGDLLLGTRSGVTYNMSWPPASALNASTFLGSTTTSNPSLSNDLTTGLYTSAAAQVGVVITTTPKASWTASRTYDYNPVTINLNTGALASTLTGSVLQLGNTTSTPTRIESDAYGASAYLSSVRLDGTTTSPTAILSGDEIGGVNAWGYNGAAVAGPQASVREYAAANWTTTSNPTYVDIATTTSGSTTMAEVARFNSDGGMTLPSTVTGGDEGAGTINANGLYVNGVAVGSGSGTVTTVSVATANGFSGTVANATTTPAITIIAGAINPTSVGATTSGTGTFTTLGSANASLGGTTTVNNITINGTCVGCIGTASLSSITAATTGHTIDNGANAQEWDYNALTTGTAFKSTSTGITTGRMLDVEANNVAGTGYAGYFTNTGTGAAYGIYSSLTSAGNTGYAGYFSNTSTNGYALGINGAISAMTSTSTGAAYGVDLPVPYVFNQNGTAAYIPITQFYAPNMLTTEEVYMGLGKNISAYNSGNIVFIYNGAGSVNNVIGLGLASQSPGLFVYGNGHTLVGAALATNPPTTAISDAFQVEGGIGLTTTTATVPTNGMYSPSAGALNITSNGVAQIQISNTGGITMPNIANSATGDYVCWNAGVLGENTGTCSLSDENAKQDIIPLGGGLAEVMKFEPVQFRYRDGYGYDTSLLQIGFTAQRMDKVDHRIVGYKNGEPHDVFYDKISAINSAAIQEQQKEIQILGGMPGHVLVSGHPCLWGLLVCPD